MKKNILFLIILISSLYSNDIFLNTQIKRVYKSMIDNRIHKINIINNYIVRYMMQHGRIIPTKSDITTTYNDLILFWPKGIDNSNNIEFVIDTENMNITYKNFFKYSVKTYINQMMKNSIYLKYNSYINASNELVIIFPNDLSQLIDSLNNIENLGIYGFNVKEGTLDSKCNLNVSNYANTNVYISHGSKEYELRYCDANHISFEYLPLVINKYTNNLTNSSYSYISEELYNESNSTNAESYIYNGTKLLRIKK